MNKLEQLRTMTDVVADTGDIEAIRRYQPLDATTNPSLLLKAAQLPQYADLLQASIAKTLQQQGSSSEQLSRCVDHFAVALGAEILKIIAGRISTEVDARLSFDTRATVERARQILALYEQLGINRDRVLIKIASTWEGIEAAKILEQEGVKCNLTLLFGFSQAVACANAGAYLISPFVGRILDWHKASTGRSSYPAAEDPGVISVSAIYRYYKAQGINTVVMGASFRNIGEIEQLAGCDRLTISPGLLEELAADQGELPRMLSTDNSAVNEPPMTETEQQFRWSMNDDAMATEKLAEGIRNFAADQCQLESQIATLAKQL